MSFAATIRNRNSERVIALVSALAVMLSMMVIFATPALAHHPVISASSRCDEQGLLQLSITSRSWTMSASEAGNHDDVRVQVQLPGSSTWHEVGDGEYTQANGRSFTLLFDGSAVITGTTTFGSVEGQTIGIRAQVQDTNGGAGGVGWYFNNDTVNTGASSGNTNSESTMTLALTDCDTPPPPPTWACVNGEVVELNEGDQGYPGPYDSAEEADADEGCTPPPPPPTWACVNGEVVELNEGDQGYPGPYDSAEEADADEGCTPPPPPPTWACVNGEVVELNEGDQGYPGPYDSAEEADADEGCTPPPPPPTWACVNGEVVELNEGDQGYPGPYDSAEEADADEGCTPPPPPPTWACVNGEVVELNEGDQGYPGPYGTEEEAANDPGCQEVAAATTFTIGGTCALVGDVASFTISGSLGEGLTLTVAGQTIDTSPFSVNTGAAGSFPYSVVLDEGFELAVGSPAAAGVILIQDCTIDDEIEDVDELPFTGIDAGRLAVASIALLGTGTMVLMSSRRREES